MSPARARGARRGFTLVELLVAIGLSAVVATGLYSLSMVASQTFQQQLRISEIQLRLRSAVETLRADVARAGYMATPSSTVDPRVCPRPAAPLQAVRLAREASNPTHNPTANTGIDPVRLVLTGNYLSTDEYLVMGIEGATVYLQQQTQAFARIGDATSFARTFVGRTVRLMGANGMMQFGRVEAVSFAPPGGTVYPSLRLSSAPVVIGGEAASGSGATAGCGIPGLGVGATVAPVTMVEYRIASVAGTQSNAYAGSAAFTTGKTDLVRVELNPAPGGPEPIAGSERIVAEYAVDFDVAAVVADTLASATGDPAVRRLAWGDPQNFQILGGVGTSGAAPQRVRSLVVRLSVRDRTQDPDFGWVRRDPGDPLTRFQVFPGQRGAARVRSIVAEIALPNVTARNLF